MTGDGAAAEAGWAVTTGLAASVGLAVVGVAAGGDEQAANKPSVIVLPPIKNRRRLMCCIVTPAFLATHTALAPAEIQD